MTDRAAYQLAAIVLGGMACGMALVILFSLERTRANIANALAGIAVGIAFATPIPFIDRVDAADPGWLPRIQGLAEAAVIFLSVIYMGGLLATSQRPGRAAEVIRWVIRIGWVQAAWVATAALLFPAQRLNDYELSGFDAAAHDEPGFWLFAVSWIVIGITFGVGWVSLALVGLDSAESARAIATAAASVLLVCSTVTPWVVTGALGVVALTVYMWGHVHHAAAQARRATFLGQFLSPKVSEMIESKGISTVMRPHQAELSVIACDLRGFTSYSEGVPSQAVVDLLAEYYDAVGDAVARHGGTITCYAGDGVLMLAGAPLPRDDHAVVAVALAQDLIEAVNPVLERWATRVHPLGLGVGVASGTVTVGTIGSSNRLDYTAVGTPVNLAARLCAAAGAGEVLIDEDAARLGTARVVERGAMAVKGLAGQQMVFALEDVRAPAQVTRGSATLSTEPDSTTS